MLLAKKSFKCHAWVEKCHFGKIAKMALLNPCMKFEIFLAKSILLKHYENGNKKKTFIKCPRVRQIKDLCRKKYKKVIF